MTGDRYTDGTSGVAVPVIVIPGCQARVGKSLAAVDERWRTSTTRSRSPARILEMLSLTTCGGA